MAPSVNYLTKTLSGSLTDSATTITLNNTTNMLAPGYIVINRTNSSGTATPDSREVVYYTGISGSDLTGCTRGADGSNRAHADSSLVETTLTAGAWNSLTTIVSTGIDNNGYLRAIASPVSIARMQIVQEAVTSIASIARAEIGTLVTGTFNPASMAITSIASIARIATNSIQQGYDGWITATDTWTYASAVTFTISGVDRTAIYTKGTRLKLTQSTGGTKYFVVVSSAFGTDTTVTITAGTSYTLNNEAITAPFYSYMANPAGYPTSFAYTATWSCSGSMTISAGSVDFTRFSVIGNRCTWTFAYSAFTLGGTQSTEIYATLPISSSRSASGFANDMNCCYQVDGGTSKVGQVGIKDTTPGTARFRNTVEGNWTLGSTNSYLAGQLTYEF